jgi:hypothetical protein
MTGQRQGTAGGSLPAKKSMGWRLLGLRIPHEQEWLAMKTSLLSRPGSRVMSEHFTKSPGVVLRSSKICFYWWY